jgi:aquaporin Z
MSMIYALGNISGAHLNPAVSIAFAIAGRFSVKEVFPYIVSQCIGAILASLLLRYLFPTNSPWGITQPIGSEIQSFILEFILSFVLMFVIINVTTNGKEHGLFAGIAIGGFVMLAAIFGGPISGASMNPARSLGPALISGHLNHFWIYVVAPIAGAASSIAVWKYLTSQPKNQAK